MQRTLLRILRGGLLAAVILAVAGYAMVSVGGAYLGAQPDARNPGLNDHAADQLRYRVPLVMALWGFVLVAGFELLASLVRRPAPTRAPPPPAESPEQVVERLLKQVGADTPSQPPPPADSAPSSPRPGPADPPP